MCGRHPHGHLDDLRQSDHRHGSGSPGSGADGMPALRRQRSQSTLSMPSSEELGRDDRRLAACNEKLSSLVQKLIVLKDAGRHPGR